MDEGAQYVGHTSPSTYPLDDSLKHMTGTIAQSLSSSASSVHSSATSSTTAPPPVPPLPPAGYNLLRKTPRTISSIEQFDFKSFPEQSTTNNNNNKNPSTTLTSSSGLTTLSSFTVDTFTALTKQPSQKRQQQQQQQNEKDMDNSNNIALESLRTSWNHVGPTGSDDSSCTNDMTDKGHQQRQQLQEAHNQLMTFDSHQDILQQDNNQDNNDHQKRQRNYQVFPGNSTFFCGGRFMTSKEYWAFIIAFLMIVVPSILFGIFTCPFLWYNIHPVIPVLFAYMFAIAISSMFKVSWTDPGIIPRGLDPTPTLEPFDDRSSIWTQPFPADRCVKIKDVMWNLKYCGTCKIYRPPRASHCRQCDNCVENDDHHCIWLNNCIGKRNYRPFFTFITTCTLMAIYLIVFTVLHLFMAARQIQPDINFDLVFRTTPVSFVLAIIGFFLLWMVGGLTTYHCHLVWKGVTTHEKLRSTLWEDQRTGHPNPYGKRNPIVNIIQILCRPQPKSHLRRRKYIDTP